MAMTLRLSDEQNEALRQCAESQGRSMQEVAKEAIDQYLSDRSKRLDEAIALVASRDAELLDRLSR